MPEALLVALPVIGGFLAAINLDRSRFRIARDRGYRFYFRVVHYALLLVGAAVVLSQLFGGAASWIAAASAAGPIDPDLRRHAFWGMFTSLHASQWQLAFLAFGLGYVAPRILNLPPGTQEKHIFHAVQHQDFERMVAKSLTDGKPMCITLKTGQVYVGWAVHGPNPEMVRRWLRVLPLASGYRDDTQRIQLKVNYAPIYKELQDDRGAFEKIHAYVDVDDFEVVISIEEISGVHLFHLDVYRLFDPEGATSLFASSPTIDLDQVEPAS